MRICYIGDGRSIHFHRWISFFTERGHAVHFISYKPMESLDVRAIQKVGGIYHGELGAFHIKRFWRTLRDLSWLMQVLRRERIELLHCHFLGVNAWYAALSRFHPLVITVMGGDVSGLDWRPRGVRERLLTPLALRQASLVTSWSYQMANVIRPYCRERIPVEVIHGGVDLEVFCPEPKPDYLRQRWNIPPDVRVIFSPRLMRPLSNIHQIAKAAGRICEAHPNAYFLFAAPHFDTDTDYEARVRELLRQGGVADRVRFVGTIPHGEMADYYRLADVTVSIASIDGTPMSVLESMACGTPVVVNDNPNLDPDYIEPGKTVLAAKADDAESVARAVLRLLQEPALAKGLAAEGKRRVEAMGNCKVQMSRMEHLYKVLSQSQSG